MKKKSEKIQKCDKCGSKSFYRKTYGVNGYDINENGELCCERLGSTNEELEIYCNNCDKEFNSDDFNLE